MRESRPYGSVRGVPGDRRPYRDPGNPRPAPPEGYDAHAVGVGLDLMCRSLSHQVKGYSLCELFLSVLL
jgi:hypothetical protein